MKPPAPDRRPLFQPKKGGEANKPAQSSVDKTKPRPSEGGAKSEGGANPLVGVRMPPDLLEYIDYLRRQATNLPTRPQMIIALLRAAMEKSGKR